VGVRAGKLNPHSGVALVLVGDELLDGRVRESNSVWLIERLARLRARVDSVQIVGDRLDAIAAAIGRAAATSVAVVVTGGLGPTTDDITREALAQVADEELVLDPALLETLEERWRRRGRAMPESNRRQAMRTRSGRPIANPRGTAPGLLHLLDGVPVVLLPGVPAELHAMWEGTAEGIVAPLTTGGAAARLRLRTARLAESSLADLVEQALSGTPEAPQVEPAYLVTEFGVDLMLYARGDDVDLRACAVRLLPLLRPHVYSVGDDGLEQVVISALIERGETVAVGESCTGGLLGGCITRVPGSSAAFLGGVLAYANAVKAQELGVAPSVLHGPGAVSEEAALQMAVGARARMGATWGLAVTGVAGPDGGSPEKPVGTTWVACAGPSRSLAERSQFPGDRHQNRTWSVAAALDLLRRELRLHPELP
jgi:nicotinamide-nucleotide amidase